MKPILLLDIDHTIINNQKLHRLVINKLLLDILTPRKLLKNIRIALIYLTAKVEFLKKIKPDDYLDTIFDPKIYKHSLYYDVIPTLRYLKTKVRLGIFSEGKLHMQLIKLNFSGVDKFLDNHLKFIFPNKVTKIDFIESQIRGKKLYFVDNKKTIISTLSQRGYQVFLLDRNDVFPKLVNIIKIRSLRDLIAFFKYLGP